MPSFKSMTTPLCQRIKLSNGLNVLAIPHKQAPVVAIQGWIRFGSADESEATAGLAHLFEHLLFKGTERRPVGAIAHEIESLGGDLNAYTTYDHTVMHMTLGAKHLSQGLDILSDSLMNSVVDKDELVREREVVLEEIRRRNDMPSAIASDLLRERLFEGHPYARPVIGYSSVVAAMSREDILAAYRRYYNTNNIFLVISGDFDESKLAEECEKYFSKMKTGPRPDERPALNPLNKHHNGFKHNPSPDSLLHFGWQGPVGAHDDTAALDAFALIIGQGDSSRLVRKLVHEEKLLREIGAGFWGPKESGSFQISMRGTAGASKKYKAIVDGIDECLNAPLSEAELDKAKKNLLASATYSKETVDGMAQRFGYYESIASDWQGDLRYLEAVRRLSISDLERVRNEYINWDRAVAAGIVPKGESLPQFSPPKKIQAKAPTLSASAKKDFGVESFQFRGLKVLVKTVSHIPLFSLRWAGLGGARLEPSTAGGLGSLWSRSVVNGGTSSDGKLWSREELNEKVDCLSAGLSAFHGKNSFGYQVDGLSDDFAELFQLLLAIKNNPTFDQKLVNEEKSHQLADLKTSEDSPSTVAGRLFSEKMFGNHPYGRTSIGSSSSIKKITASHLAAYHKKLEAQPQVLSIVGNITPQQVETLLKRHLAQNSFKKAPTAITKNKVTYAKKPSHEKRFLKKEQSHIILGYPTCTLFEKDRWALLGLSAVLGGQGGRLFMELRDKMSLCYTVSPTHMEGIDGGYFGFYIATAPDKIKIAIDALHKEIERLVEKGVDDEEWKKACTYYTGNFEIEQQRLAAQSMGMALDELYGLGFKEYFQFDKNLRALKASDLNRVAQKYFSSAAKKSEVSVIVGPK